jgi:hypothetical protein
LYPEQTLFTSANVVKTRNLFRVIQQTRQLSLAFLFIMGSLSSYTIFANEQVVEIIQAQFVRYDPDYHTHYENYGVRLDASANKLARLEAQGRNLHCSKQIFLEAKWLHRYTAHWDELDDKLERLELSFEEEDQEFANRQSPTTGFWGTCYESYFMRMGATVDALSTLSLAGKTPRYKIRGTGEFSTGKKLLTRLQDLLISDIARTGVNNRAQLSSLITSISQGLFKDYIREGLERSRDARFDSKLPGLEDAFRFFLSGAQDPQTGYWGAWYIIDGKVHKTSDLSMTYHIVSYTKGKGLERWQNLITTTLAIESDPYPYGWKHREEFNNHNLYDVAKIFKYGWRHMKPSQRASISTQIQSMLDWSLSNTLGEDGRFIYKPEFSDSLADEYYFGVSFYDVIGYWNPEYRFWTDQSEFEGAMELCCQIERRLNELDLSGWAADGARAKLARNCTGC